MQWIVYRICICNAASSLAHVLMEWDVQGNLTATDSPLAWSGDGASVVADQDGGIHIPAAA